MQISYIEANRRVSVFLASMGLRREMGIPFSTSHAAKKSNVPELNAFQFFAAAACAVQVYRPETQVNNDEHGGLDVEFERIMRPGDNAEACIAASCPHAAGICVIAGLARNRSRTDLVPEDMQDFVLNI